MGKITLNSLHELLSNYMTVTDLKFKNIESTLESIKVNHLPHIENSIGKLKSAVTTNTNDIKWIKKIQWYAITLSVSTLVGIVVSIYLTLTLK